MPRVSKRIRQISEKVVPGKQYTADEAISLLKEVSKVKFNETIEICVNLGINTKNENVRGASVLPNGTGKSVRVAVFAEGPDAEKARAAGADVVGLQDLADRVKAGEIPFDVAIATPDAMKIIVTQLGQILGPKGLMPNPKVGTVTVDVTNAVKNAKAGQVRYRTDKNGIIHCAVGKINFDAQAIKQNLQTILNDLKKLKPSTSKGIYIKRVTLATTMGPGLWIDHGSIEG